MLTREVSPREENEALLGKRVQEADCVDEVKPGTIITCQGKPVIIYGSLEGDFSEVRGILHQAPYSKNRRLTQLMNDHEVKTTVDLNFGYNPSNPIFGTSAGPCKFNTKYPAWYQRMLKLGQRLAGVYQYWNPEQYGRHSAEVREKIKPHWVMEGTPFTQAVINNANALGYHYDRDNVVGAWSCMIYFKQGVTGGNLIVPSLGLKFMCEDQAYMLFDGQSKIHGVTPIVKRRLDAYRYSIVYYSRASMVGLGSYEEELAHAKEIEFNKHKRRLAARQQESDR